MNDRIELRDLRVDTIIGIHDWERRVPQRLYFDLDLPTDAARTDDVLERTLDYDAAAAEIRAFVTASERTLIESLADDLARFLLERYALPWVQVVLAKPGAVADCAPVRIVIRRTRDA